VKRLYLVILVSTAVLIVFATCSFLEPDPELEIYKTVGSSSSYSGYFWLGMILRNNSRGTAYNVEYVLAIKDSLHKVMLYYLTDQGIFPTEISGDAVLGSDVFFWEGYGTLYIPYYYTIYVTYANKAGDFYITKGEGSINVN
jgi:hypothetical protein